MKSLKELALTLPFVEQKSSNTGKIIVKTVLITAAVLAFIPTVIKVNKGKGFDAYGLLSHIKYEKSTNEEGKTDHNIIVDLVDLERYGISKSDV